MSRKRGRMCRCKNRYRLMLNFLKRRQRTTKTLLLLQDCVEHLSTPKIWQLPRFKGFFFEYAYTRPSHAFQEDFRLSRQAFQYLCEVLRPRLQHQTTQMRMALTVEERIAISLFCLGIKN